MTAALALLPPGLGSQLVCLLVAFALSAVIGLERQLRLKTAGLRTHTLVGLGAAVFTLVSAHGFAGGEPGIVADPTRIAAQIVSGIGFLGAGVIFVRREVVSGLTTAASIWVTAAIGMASAAGMIVIAVVATGLHLITVWVFTGLRRHLSGARRPTHLLLRYREGRGALRHALEVAHTLGCELTLVESAIHGGKGRDLRIDAQLLMRPMPDERLNDLLGALSDVEGIVKVRTMHPEPL